MLRALAAAALLAASTSLPAQGAPPPSDADRAARRAEMREKAKAAHAEARKACEGRKGDEHRACMQKTFCAKAPDPARCEARMKERAERRAEQKKRRTEEKKDASK